jgi:mono/diheme cytochrome c family protein
VGPGKFPTAPAINGAATAARSDGYIYGVIVVGRGLMPAYGEKVTHADRWAVVTYLRQLQAQGGAAAAVPAAPTTVNPPDVTAGGAPLADTTGQQQP